MRQGFEKALRLYFAENEYTIDTTKVYKIYIRDEMYLKPRRTWLSIIPERSSFEILNPSMNFFSHICIDGGLIEYGRKDYVGDGKEHGRNDFMIVTDNKLLLVELKMEGLENSQDKSKWRLVSKGLKQIEDFYYHLQRIFQMNGNDFHSYYGSRQIIPIISIKFKPELKRNAQRNTEIVRFSERTGLRFSTDRQLNTSYSI